ncbi:MAG: NAD(P)H-dependent oxidoreductase subunit E [Nitrospina sp.]|nr:NAD(P)H-dependent oxidoreductase subunit E [Nitrospina sp.]
MTEATETAEATLEAPEEKKICMTTFYKILDSFPARERRYLIPMMTKVQNEFRFLPPELTEVLREELNVTRAEIYGIISFYPQFRIEEPGKYIFKLCYGTACFVKGAPIIAQKLKEKFSMGKGETDPSKLFTLEFASCLGNCGAAPMAIIGEDTYGNIDPEKTYSDVTDNYAL